jgi:hypothetical protein
VQKYLHTPSQLQFGEVVRSALHRFFSAKDFGDAGLSIFKKTLPLYAATFPKATKQ